MKTFQSIFYKLKCQQKYSFFVFAFIFIFTLLYTAQKEQYLFLATIVGVIYIFLGFQVAQGQSMILDRESKFVETFSLMGLNSMQYYFSYVMFYWFLTGTQIINLFLLASLVDYVMLERLNPYFVKTLIFMVFASFQSSCIGAACSFGIKKVRFASFFLAITQYLLFALVGITLAIQNDFLKELFQYIVPQNFLFNHIIEMIIHDHHEFSLPYLKALVSSIVTLVLSYILYYIFNLKFEKVIDMFDYEDRTTDLEQHLITDGLKITNLNHYFGEFQALKDINMFVKEGEFICLMGHNGAGKSTLINVLTGIHSASSGKIELNGKKFQPEELNIGVCPAYDVLFEDLNVRQQIKTIALLKSKPVDIEQIIENFGLQDYEHMKIKELSGGYRRRVMMAICSMGNPDILFLDEPTSAIDAESRVFLWKVLKQNKKINKHQITFLTTHHLEEAEYLSDNISVLVKGKIYVTDNIENIKKIFGVGYKINVFTENKQFINDIKSEFQFLVNDDLQQETTKLIVSIPFQHQEKIIDVLSFLKKSNLEYSINSNTLEQSYIDIEKQAHYEQYKGSQEKAIKIVEKLFINKVKNSFEYTLFMIKDTFGSVLNLLTLVISYSLIGGVILFFMRKNHPESKNIYAVLNQLVYFEIILLIFIPLEYLSDRVNHIKRLMFTQKVSIINYYCTKIITNLIKQIICYIVLFIFIYISFGYVSDQPNYSNLYTIFTYMTLRAFVFINVSSLLQFIWVDKKYLLVYFIILYLLANDLFQMISERSRIECIKNIFGLNLLRKQIQLAILGQLNFEIFTVLTFLLIGFVYFLIVQVLEIYWNNYNYVRSQFTNPIDSSNKLEINKLYKKYKTYVVKNFNMDLKKGHYSGLLGPNGAGKSTVIKMMLNQQLKTRGNMRFNDNRESNSLLSLFNPKNIVFNNNNLACVFQENSIFQKKKVQDIVDFFARMNNCDPEQIENLLKYFYMDVYKNNTFNELSSGNQRKLCIFISLLINPDFIVFDEATCGIDLMMRLKLKDLFDEFKKNGASGVFTTHFLKDIEIFCDHLCIIKNGKKIKDDSLDNIRKDESSYIIRLKYLSQQEEIERDLNKQGFIRFNEIQYQDEHMTTVDYHFKRIEDIQNLLEYLLDKQKKQLIKEFEIRQYTIDDIYVKILKEN